MHRLRKYSDECFSRLSSQLKKYSKEDEIETLHNVRVEIKKIKAVLQLIKAYVKGFHAHRNFIPLRVIFRAAGKIRDPELLREQQFRNKVKNFNVPAEDKSVAIIRKFRARIPDCILSIGNLEARLKKHLAKISKTQINTYLEKKEKILKQQLRGKWTERSLHKIRKLTKEILYVGVILKKSRKDFRAFLGQLQELVGQWHDGQALLTLLVKQKDPDFKRIKDENDKSIKRIRELVWGYYDI